MASDLPPQTCKHALAAIDGFAHQPLAGLEFAARVAPAVPVQRFDAALSVVLLCSLTSAAVVARRMPASSMFTSPSNSSASSALLEITLGSRLSTSSRWSGLRNRNSLSDCGLNVSCSVGWASCESRGRSPTSVNVVSPMTKCSPGCRLNSSRGVAGHKDRVARVAQPLDRAAAPAGSTLRHAAAKYARPRARSSPRPAGPGQTSGRRARSGGEAAAIGLPGRSTRPSMQGPWRGASTAEVCAWAERQCKVPSFRVRRSCQRRIGPSGRRSGWRPGQSETRRWGRGFPSGRLFLVVRNDRIDTKGRKIDTHKRGCQNAACGRLRFFSRARCDRSLISARGGVESNDTLVL